tara:strand:- start:1099 stop:1974 length:876 start_codon:yes stop_codon:yes gene_type:complete
MIKILITLFLFFTSCSNQQEKSFDETYPFKGVIIKKIDEKQQMLINHDEVPGFMDKMVMTFNIDSSVNMDMYNIGDSLNFNFYIAYQSEGPAKTWASDIKIVGHRELGKGEDYDDFFDDFYAIDIGEKLSDATFLNFENERVKLSKWDGKFKFISFVFSRCPMPNFCPALISKNLILSNKFLDNDNIEFVIISFDYKYDTPQVLKEAYGYIDNENVHFLSSYGQTNDLIKITQEAGLGFSGIDDGDEREIGHTLKSLVIDPNGVLIESYSGDDWKPKDVANDIIERMKLYK